ncbi:MAG: hypothetical protein ACRDDP_06680 [Plesiomonas sp.]
MLVPLLLSVIVLLLVIGLFITTKRSSNGNQLYRPSNTPGNWKREIE